MHNASVVKLFQVKQIVFAVCIAIILPAPALSDLAAAESCAAKLSANQMLIYRTAKPDITPSADLTTVVRPKVIALVKAGQLPHASAPDDATVAARCLKLLQS